MRAPMKCAPREVGTNAGGCGAVFFWGFNPGKRVVYRMGEEEFRVVAGMRDGRLRRPMFVCKFPILPGRRRLQFCELPRVMWTFKVVEVG